MPTDWTFLIAPMTGFLGALLGARVTTGTTLHTHTERIKMDKELAEKRAAAELDLAVRKMELDRDLAAWKRRGEIAEEVLADLYQAADVIGGARLRIFTSHGEAADRPARENETEDDKQTLDAYYVVQARLEKRAEFFYKMLARRHICVALFGNEAREPFDLFARARISVFNAAANLTNNYYRKPPAEAKTIARLQAIIWDTDAKDDPVRRDIETAIKVAERLFRPVMEWGQTPRGRERFIAERLTEPISEQDRPDQKLKTGQPAR